MNIAETDTLIVGGGQAGLATSYYLSLLGHDHIILERSENPGDAWRNRSWDSFTLVTPNWAFRMPGAEYNGPAREGFMPGGKVMEFFEEYIDRFKLPIKFNTTVIAVTSYDGKYLVQTNDLNYSAKNVVIATGFFQHPKIPRFAAGMSPNIHQFHSSIYRNPPSLPKGNVLVVGSGQSGCQIAEELSRAGRKVFLSVGTAGRVPRRYRGKDVIEWLELAGFFSLTPEQLPPGMEKFGGIPHLSGVDGGHTINLHQFARNGIKLMGRVQGTENLMIALASNLYKNLEAVDNFERDVTHAIDGYIQANGLPSPSEGLPQLRDGYDQSIIEELDLKKEGINTVIWATGYTFDYSLVKLPVFDQDGFPIQSSGVTPYPGLYFVGIPWMPTERTGSLLGVGESAGHIASTISGVISADNRITNFSLHQR